MKERLVFGRAVRGKHPGRHERELGTQPESWQHVEAAVGRRGRAFIGGAWLDVELVEVSAEPVTPVMGRWGEDPEPKLVVGVWVWCYRHRTHFWIARLRNLRVPLVLRQSEMFRAAEVA